MVLSIKIKTQKKARFFLQSALVTVFLFLFAFGKFEISYGLLALGVTSLVIFGTVIVHYPNVDLKNCFFVLLMPLSLIIGALLFLNFFPNLGTVFKTTTIIIFGLLHYLVSLVDNVFLVAVTG